MCGHRKEVLGSSIADKRKSVAHAGQMILSRIDARNGAIAIYQFRRKFKPPFIRSRSQSLQLFYVVDNNTRDRLFLRQQFEAKILAESLKNGSRFGRIGSR
jgi:hypothetical protein